MNFGRPISKVGKFLKYAFNTFPVAGVIPPADSPPCVVIAKILDIDLVEYFSNSLTHFPVSFLHKIVRGFSSSIFLDRCNFESIVMR